MTSDKQKRFYTYIILCKNGTYYTGYSNNPQERFNKHLSGKGAKYTRAHKPDKLALVSPAMTKSEAMRLECKIKTLSHDQKKALIREYNNSTMSYLQYTKETSKWVWKAK